MTLKSKYLPGAHTFARFLYVFHNQRFLIMFRSCMVWHIAFIISVCDRFCDCCTYQNNYFPRQVKTSRVTRVTLVLWIGNETLRSFTLREHLRVTESWKFGGFTFIILKPRAEGYETEIVANFAVRGPINRLTCMRKTQAQNTLTVWVFASDETRARRNTASKLHGTSPRGETKFHWGSRRSANG